VWGGFSLRLCFSARCLGTGAPCVIYSPLLERKPVPIQRCQPPEGALIKHTFKSSTITEDLQAPLSLDTMDTLNGQLQLLFAKYTVSILYRSPIGYIRNRINPYARPCAALLVTLAFIITTYVTFISSSSLHGTVAVAPVDFFVGLVLAATVIMMTLAGVML
jgi:hypothetical protein